MPAYSHLLASLLLISLVGCAPLNHPPSENITTPQLTEQQLVTADGASLPVRSWLPPLPPQAVLLALHGFNDYSRFFEKPGNFFSSQGIACFAYDQRGFGAAPQHGLWAGNATYINDLQTITRLIKQRYPSQPLYILGESMGGAVIINAMRQAELPEAAGIILSAPAVWSRATMPWYQTGLLWTLAHTLPWLTLTGRGLHITASDNIEMLKELGRDPLVIKATRVETVYGLSELMDTAYESAATLHGNILLLYGEKDEIIPKTPTQTFLQQLQAVPDTDLTVALYPHGYHMLLRDLQAPTAWQDIVAWIKDNPASLPSGADARAKTWLSNTDFD